MCYINNVLYVQLFVRMHIITCVNHDGDMNINFTIIVCGVGRSAALSDGDLVGVHNQLFPTVYVVLGFEGIVVLSLWRFPDAVGQALLKVFGITDGVLGGERARCIVGRGVHPEQWIRYLGLGVRQGVIGVADVAGSLRPLVVRVLGDGVVYVGVVALVGGRRTGG